MINLWLLIKKDYLELRRSKKLLVLLILFLFVAITSPITAKMLPQIMKVVSVPGITINMPDPTYKDALDQFVKNLSQIGLLVLIFLAASAVAEERSRKSLEVMLTKPITRGQFIISKYLTYLGTISAVYLAAAAIFYFYTGSLFSGMSGVNFLIIVALLLQYILLLVSVTICASTICKSSLAAAGVGFLFFIGISIVSALASRISDYLPDHIISAYPQILTQGWESKLLYPLGISIVLIGAAIWLSVVHFRNQEIER